MANMARLVGHWRQEPPDLPGTHLELSLKGSDIVVTEVWDRDDFPRKIVKGTTQTLARFRLNGRRVYGNLITTTVSHTLIPFTGIVSETFKKIYFSYQVWYAPNPNEVNEVTWLRE